ncbi:hypothetical protein BLNAU_8367 [Blattamonas nauphoetae]|uniref:Uncharacterized protein n=1 Tax=Blattamonas nauphoetae TaxID=2049346 RepID=A0ABQ9XYZ5_9EUKA|nr:hypothetical protein BLNAU_8367 [Blattamonas nauphoetae]
MMKLRRNFNSINHTLNLLFFSLEDIEIAALSITISDSRLFLLEEPQVDEKHSKSYTAAFEAFLLVHSVVDFALLKSMATRTLFSSENGELIEERREQAIEERREQAIEERREQAIEERREQAIEERREQAIEERREQAIEERREQAIEVPIWALFHYGTVAKK